MISAIVKKDLLGLLPLVLLAAAVFFIQPVITDLELQSDIQFWAMLKTNFYWLSYFLLCLLIVSVIQLDPAASQTHDWLTRPIAHVDWFLAKIVFLLLTICVPVILARTLVNLINDYSLGVSLLNATAIENPPGLLPMPFLFAIALLTGTLRKTIFFIIAIVMIFISPAWSATVPLLAILGINLSSDYDALMWMQALPIAAAGLAAMLSVYWYQYCRRQSIRAHIVFSFALLLVFFSMFTPSSLYNWDKAIAMQTSLVNGPDLSLEENVFFEHAQSCFPAEIAGSEVSGNFGASVLERASWQDRYLSDAGPGSVTFATTVESRRILVDWFFAENIKREFSVDWRIHRIRTQGSFSADSLAGDVLVQRSFTAVNRFAPMTNSDTDYWLIPGELAQKFAKDPSTKFTVDFDLALMSPTTYELKTDGQRREFPELGFCSAEKDAVLNTIEVECVKRGPQPALMSAELIGIKSSRVDSYHQPNYKPDWLERIGGERYELTLESSNLVNSSSILLTAYTLERILHKQVVSAGLLGDSASLCPSPMETQFAVIEKSNWSDKSPHEVSSIAVDRGVRLEVLDWRTVDQTTEAPTLFMIPGLGATAHSYDDLAVKLSEKYPVIAMTRRGTGDSSKPEYGYEIERLSQDVLQVLNTLDIDSVILVGHSMGSEELNFIGANYPDRVAGLVYLDAAYDRTRTNKELRAVEVLLPPAPAPTPGEFISYEAAHQYAQRIGAVRNIPEGEILASFDFATGANKHNTKYIEAIQMSVQVPDYARISVPALGVFAVPGSPEALMEPWYDKKDPELPEILGEKFRLETGYKREHIRRFEQGIKDARVLVLEDADHWIFLSHETEVLEAIDEFIESLLE